MLLTVYVRALASLGLWQCCNNVPFQIIVHGVVDWVICKGVFESMREAQRGLGWMLWCASDHCSVGTERVAETYPSNLQPSLLFSPLTFCGNHRGILLIKNVIMGRLATGHKCKRLDKHPDCDHMNMGVPRCLELKNQS